MLTIGVVPVLVGPLQVLMAILPALLLTLGGMLLALFRPSGIKKLVLLLWSQKLVVAPAAILVIAAVHYWPVMFPSARAAVREAGTADWPLWRGSPDRRGVVPGAKQEPTGGQVRWSFVGSDAKAFYSSPTVVANRVYVTGANYVPPITDSGAIYSVDADSGRLVWQFTADRYRATFSSPAVSGKYLVVGEGLHWTRDSRVFCIDIERSEATGEGVKLWDFRTASHVESSPCIDDGKVYFGAGDDGFYCLKLDPDAAGKPVVIWHADGREYPDCEPSPVVWQGRVYFGLGNGGKAMVCLDAATGRRVWRVDAPQPIFGSPAVADGKVVVGMGIGNYVNSAEEVAANLRKQMLRAGKSDQAATEAAKDIVPAGQVWCIDAVTGRVIWKFTDVERTVLGSPAIADGLVYFGSRDKRLYCLSLADGSLVGKFDAGGPIVSGPAVGQETVYLVTQTGRLFGLARQDLQATWAVDLNSNSMSSPAVARGHVYVGTDTNGLLCVGDSGAIDRREIWPGPLGGSGKSGRCDGSLIPARASPSWTHVPAVDGGQGAIEGPMAYLGGAVYAGLGGEGNYGLAALSIAPADGKIAKPVVKWFQPTDNPVVISPAATDEAVLMVDGLAGDDGRALRCLDPTDGRQVWRRPVAADASGKFVITFGRVFIADAADRLSCLDMAGQEVWSVTTASCDVQPALAGDILLVACVRPARLLALDAPTGEVLWEAKLPAKAVTGPIPAGGNVWLGVESGLTAFDILSGRLRHSIQCRPAAVPLVCDRTNVACVTDTGQIILVGAEDGRPVGPFVEGADNHMPPLLTGQAMLYFTTGAIRRLDTRTGESSLVRKLYPKWEGRVTSPMLVLESHILYATEKKGLTCLTPRKK